MPSTPVNPDPEQQRADNTASRRQSGLEPQPREQQPDPAQEPAKRKDTDGQAGSDRGRSSGAGSGSRGS